MKKTVKILSFVLALVLIVSCATACGGKKTKSSIKFGTNAEFAPFEYVVSGDKKGIIGNYDGIDIAIADKIAKGLGKTAEIENIEFDSLILALKNGQIDAIIAGMTVTPDRAKEVDFSKTYYEATQVMIVKEDSDVKSAADMAGKKIAVVQGYTGETTVQKLGYKVNDDYVAFKKGTEAVLELVNGKCDVVVIDSATAQKYVSDNEGLKIVKDDGVFEGEEYAIAVKKGNTELLDQINVQIAKLLADGTVSSLAASYTAE